MRPNSIYRQSTTSHPLVWLDEKKLISRIWLLRILEIEVKYTPLGSRTLRHPLRCSLRFGKTSMLGLVDTGSDYDALHAGFFRFLAEQEPSICLGQQKVKIGDVVGFVSSCKMQTTGECRTVRVVIEGAARYLSPHPKRKSLDIPFNLFDGLSEPFVLGMPSVDHSGGVEVLAKHICLAGVWIPRALPGQHSKGALRHFNLAYADIEPYARRTADGTPYYGPRVPPQTFSVGTGGWSQVTTYWPPDLAERISAYNAKDGYLEISPEWDGKIEVISTVVPVGDGRPQDPHNKTNPYFLEMDVLVRSLTGETQYLSTQDRFCSLVPATAEHHDEMTSFRMAYMCREEEDNLTPLPAKVPDVFQRTTQMEDFKKEFVKNGLDQDLSLFSGSKIMLLMNGYESVDRPQASPLADPLAPSRFDDRRIYSQRELSEIPPLYDSDDEGPGMAGGDFSDDDLPTMATARYKSAAKTDEQAKLFPALQTEIKERRQVSQAKIRDQNSEKFKDELCKLAKDKNLVPPEHYDLVCRKIIRPFSDRFWDEGCAAPDIKGFKAHIDLKPDADLKYRQHYRLSKFDETRLAFLYEEAEREGKVEKYQLGETLPVICTPCIMVDKKGSLIGRKVGDFRMFNKVTMDYHYPAPEADAVLLEATGKKYHTTFDCVWGFEQISLDKHTQEICSTITPFGCYKSKKLPMGVKQGPGIYQHMQDTAFAGEYKPSGEKLCNVFFDDTHIADNAIQEHVDNVCRVLTVARRMNIQYRFIKSEFFKSEVLLLGFMVSKEGRRADPKKTKQLREWPAYTSNADIVSHLAFANYLREFLGPEFSAKVKPLRHYAKKEFVFQDYANDKAAQAARKWLIDLILDKCVIVNPDWEAAARPWKSGRPFEAFLDASDESWCVCLTQRPKPGGTPQIIAFICKSFTDEATRWSAFEREYFCFKEGYNAVAKYVTGFTLFP